MVKQADEHDIPVIEGILLDAVKWMAECGLQNQWNESNVSQRRGFLKRMIPLYIFAM